MHVDLHTAFNLLLALASAGITAAVPILVPALLKRLGMANDKDLSDKLMAAADAAAGAAYKFALAHEGGLSNVAVHDAALATAVNYVVTKMPDTLKTLGLTPDHVHDMVSARLGVLLASDPTVSAAPNGLPSASKPSAEPPKSQ